MNSYAVSSPCAQISDNPIFVDLQSHNSFEHIFSYLAPTTNDGAKSILSFASASKDCREISRHTRLMHLNEQASASVPDHMNVTSTNGLTVLEEAQLTAERARICPNNHKPKVLISKTSLRSQSDRFHHYKTKVAGENDLLSSIQVLFIKEYERNNQQWIKAREQGELILSINNRQMNTCTSNGIKNLQQNALKDIAKNPLVHISPDENNFNYNAWRKNDYIALLNQRLHSPGETDLRIQILGPHALAYESLQDLMAKLVYMGLITAPSAQQVAHTVEQVQGDNISEF